MIALHLFTRDIVVGSSRDGWSATSWMSSNGGVGVILTKGVEDYSIEGAKMDSTGKA